MKNTYKYLKLTQPVGDMYLIKLPAKKIIEMSTSNPRKSYNHNSNSGIQRRLEPTRYNSIAKFCKSKNAMFPTPIILSAPSEKFIIDSKNKTICLPVSEDNVFCSIVDGQHRLKGIELSECADKFELFVSFIFDTDPSRDAYLFSVINGNQKPVSKSLIYDLYGLSKSRTIEKLCNKVMRELNDNEKSEMQGKIKMLGYKDELSPDGIVSQATLIDGLKKLITDDSIRDNSDIEFGNELKQLNNKKYIFRSDFLNDQQEEIIRKNLEFFNAWMVSLKQVKKRLDKEEYMLFEKSLGFSTSYKILQFLYISWENKQKFIIDLDFESDIFSVNGLYDYYHNSLTKIFYSFFRLNLDKEVYSSSASGVDQLFNDLVAILVNKGIISRQILDYKGLLSINQRNRILTRMENL